MSPYSVADPARKLQPVPDMATQNLNFIAGLNGGYFWRVDITGVWIDDVCWGKTRAEANGEVSADHVNNGISDGLVKVRITTKKDVAYASTLISPN